MLKCSLDYETRSKCDLKKHGAFRYANDPSTEILCFSLSINGAAPAIWVPKKWRHHVYDKLPWVCDDDLVLLSQPDTTISAFNSMFEAAISQACFTKATGHKAPLLKAWRCVAAMARRAALPASLKKVGEVLNLTEQKDSKGEALIRKFSIPNKKTGQFVEPTDDPEAFVEFCRYCLQDTRTEMAAGEKLKDFELEGVPLETFLLDLEINARGFPVNLDALRKAQKIVEQETKRLEQEFLVVTGMTKSEAGYFHPSEDGLKPSQGKKFLQWLQDRGYKREDLKAETLAEVLESEDFDETSLVGRALSIKKQISYASLKKIPAMIACAGPQDNRVRGTLVFHGAGTGRWSASLVQPQNFKRPTVEETEEIYAAICRGCDAEWLREMYGNPLEMISSSIRHFIHDTENGDMLDCDFSAIEARVLAWQAQEEWRLEVFRTHGRIYEASASQMFGIPLKEFDNHLKTTGKNHPLRQKGKVAELALGYRGGPGAMEKMGALKQGLTKKELPGIVKAWREASPNIVRLWNETENAFIQATKNPGQKFSFGVRCHFICTKTAGMDYLFMVLPSGRKIAYPQPKVEKVLIWKVVKMVDEEETDVWMKCINPSPEQIAATRQRYPDARIKDGLTIFSQLPGTVKWGRVLLHGGLACENNCQGIAFDFMAYAALRCAKRGYDILTLIHDQALSAFYRHLGQSFEEFKLLMTEASGWDAGMPLAASGGIVNFYKK